MLTINALKKVKLKLIRDSSQKKKKLQISAQ